jgi:hypothetical protein
MNGSGCNPMPRLCDQRGAILPLFVVAMIAMFGLVGLALDGGHGMLNKSRLQNAVDAAALSAAKVLDGTGDVVLAEAEAIATFDRNAGGPGNGEMASSYANGELTLSVQFSNTLHPFAPGTTPAQYVRVRATEFRLPGWFIPVLGIADKTVGASAVAGPSPTYMFMACNVAPMMVCGDSSDPVTFGYEIGETTVLKAAAPGSEEMGPGNFQMIRPENGPGANEVRRAMAGSFDNCFDTTQSVETQPGNMVAVIQGLNTRFGDYFGAMNNQQSTYPPDVITQEPTPQLTYNGDTDTIYYDSQPVNGDPPPSFYDYASYAADLAAGSYNNTPIDQGGTGAFSRRTMAVPVGDCSVGTSGQSSVPLLGFMCYHLLQKGVHTGNESLVYGEFIDDGCPISGRPGPEPGTGPGPYIIQLYKDHDAEAS